MHFLAISLAIIETTSNHNYTISTRMQHYVSNRIFALFQSICVRCARMYACHCLHSHSHSHIHSFICFSMIAKSNGYGCQVSRTDIGKFRIIDQKHKKKPYQTTKWKTVLTKSDLQPLFGRNRKEWMTLNVIHVNAQAIFAIFIIANIILHAFHNI